MKNYFLISFIFLISYIKSLNFPEFLDSFASSLLQNEISFPGCFDEISNGLNLLNIALNEKNNKKFILGFSTTMKGIDICLHTYSIQIFSIISFVNNILSSIKMGEIDFNILKNLLGYLIDSLFDENGNSVTYGEVIAETILRLKDL
jgi:hypothetical protein